MPQRQRTNVYAAFTPSGEPILGVFNYNRTKLEALLSERQANGQALPGEHIVACTIAFYRSKLEQSRLPIPDALLPPSGKPYTISLSSDEVAHLLHAIDVSIADIEERVADPLATPESINLGSALLEVNRALRARLQALREA